MKFLDSSGIPPSLTRQVVYNPRGLVHLASGARKAIKWYNTNDKAIIIAREGEWKNSIVKNFVYSLERTNCYTTPVVYRVFNFQPDLFLRKKNPNITNCDDLGFVLSQIILRIEYERSLTRKAISPSMYNSHRADTLLYLNLDDKATRLFMTDPKIKTMIKHILAAQDLRFYLFLSVTDFRAVQWILEGEEDKIFILTDEANGDFFFYTSELKIQEVNPDKKPVGYSYSFYFPGVVRRAYVGEVSGAKKAYKQYLRDDLAAYEDFLDSLDDGEDNKSVKNREKCEYKSFVDYKNYTSAREGLVIESDNPDKDI